jgi:hypothetical protein
MIAFWKYDQYPYCLWGPVEEMDGKLVYVKDFQGWFEPIVILSEEKANAIIAQLLQLKRNRDEVLSEIKKSYDERLRAFPYIGDK